MNTLELRHYAELEAQIRKLEAQKKELKKSIQAELETSEAKSIKTNLATFSLQERKKWTYSEDIRAREIEVKQLKKEEEEDGTATFEISKSLRVQLV